MTLPYMPVEFYNALFPSKITNSDYIDSLAQLVRRISVTIEMTGRKIQAMRYDPFRFHPAEGYYWPIPGTERPNPYSCLARAMSPSYAVDIYNSMFDD